MSKLSEYLENKEQLKIGILDYVEAVLDIMNFSDEYWINHWETLETEKEKKRILRKNISKREFSERLYNYLWIPKVSELIIIIYLEDLKGFHPHISELNRLLRRTSKQYSATFKVVKKLEELNIVYKKTAADAKHKDKQVFINKEVVRIYGDDEFRQMMLDEWNTTAKGYIERKLATLLKDKAKVEERIRLIKKNKRPKRDEDDNN